MNKFLIENFRLLKEKRNLSTIEPKDKLFSIQIGTPKFLKGSGQQGRGNGEYPI